MYSPEMLDSFQQRATEKLCANEAELNQSNTFLNETFVNILRESADATFPTIETAKQSPIWHTDLKLQELFTNKAELMARNADEKAIKAIRKRFVYDLATWEMNISGKKPKRSTPTR